MAKSVKKTSINSENEIGKLIKMIIIVTAIFGVFYLITYFINKEEEKPQEEANVEIQYDKILISGVLSQEHDDYYVLIYDTQNYNYPAYEIYLGNYSSMKNAIRVYKAELNNPLNASFISEIAKLNVSKITDLKISETTLLKIKKGKVDKYYVGEDIKKHLINLTTEKE